MKHLILSREFPPCNYTQGGIGTYAAHIANALAERGETVHVIGERWAGASKPVERFHDGRLVVHRISPDDAALYPSLAATSSAAGDEVAGMLASNFPAQWFSWVAAGLAERLVEQEGIDAVEGQEWEAPLYYLMLRRSLGLGPERRPPCIVHLHSPSEFIFRANDWSPRRPAYLTMKRLEDHVIKAADALVCPSRYLARQCELHYGFAPGTVQVIPLPMGDTDKIERTDETWRDGSVCYFGRLEPRKGVIEFVDAAVQIAAEGPSPVFEFIGADLPYSESSTVRGLVRQKIPAELRDRFVFHDPRPRAEVLAMLGKARMAVVPSRWENFPNTCVEALASGAPVLATRNGGMAEMIEHGRTGWLVEDGPQALSDRIAAALRQAIATPAERLREMGDAAAVSIRAFCDNRTIADRHIAFRSQVAARGAGPSLSLPQALPWPEQPSRPRPAVSVAPAAIRVGVAVFARRDADLQPTLHSLAAQARAPDRTVLVGASPDVQVRYDGASPGAAKQAGLVALDGAVDAVLFLEAGETLEPNALATMAGALERSPDIGWVCGWVRDGASGPVAVKDAACPAFPYQWLGDEARGPALFRLQAAAEAGGLQADAPAGFEEWGLASAMMAAGWKALRLPTVTSGRPAAAAAPGPALRSARRALMQRFPDLVALDAVALAALVEEPPAPPPAAAVVQKSARLLSRALRALRRPVWTSRRLAGSLSRRLGRRAASLFNPA